VISVADSERSDTHNFDQIAPVTSVALRPGMSLCSSITLLIPESPTMTADGGTVKARLRSVGASLVTCAHVFFSDATSGHFLATARHVYTVQYDCGSERGADPRRYCRFRRTSNGNGRSRRPGAELFAADSGTPQYIQ
jgi:hypothetical protein